MKYILKKVNFSKEISVVVFDPQSIDNKRVNISIFFNLFHRKKFKNV